MLSRFRAVVSLSRGVVACGLLVGLALSAGAALGQQPQPGRETQPRRAQPPAAAPTRSMVVPPGATPQLGRAMVPALDETRFVPDEVLFELAPSADADAVLRRYGATLIARQRFDLAGVTIIRARLDAGRDLRAVLLQMGEDASIAGAQPNFLFDLQQQSPSQTTSPQRGLSGAVGGASTASGSTSQSTLPTLRLPDSTPVPRGLGATRRVLPPQYVVEKLHLPEAHKLATGRGVRVAVIDSGVDMEHAELKGSVAGYLDAVDGLATPHAHGTSMATAIAAHGELQGMAPAVRLLVGRAFGGTQATANGKSFQILTAFEWVAQQRAKIVNLSFAGPRDRLFAKALAGARQRGLIVVAAAGNGGPKAAPLYPGADPNVIAVTATDAEDKAFAEANRGTYVAVAAPGVDVLTAEPEGRYVFSSGTSIAAAHVSGLIALLVEKQPELDLDGARKVLAESAVDLGSKGRDPVFGAGRIDAQSALARVLPVATARP
ncbi:S8 family serine peptidase [Bosea sp. (in: a-proteobacteria)]|uniref:S8 family serine peptidase n=1 Tax=Bosea sp. (in: a-proteobacteria) TaxID=1871050 RepID=UPI00121B1340|nr:S8 family serine peptidase [Bosea sp. (in: a-proteobacteria)]TAJ28781.1 MAG: peptidase S8 [Bosea sp. (in: a-proteobacteria)]